MRGLSPWPGAWTTLCKNGEPDEKGVSLKVYTAGIALKECPQQPVGTIVADKNTLAVVTGEGLLEIKSLQLAGKKRMEAKAFLNGYKDIADCRMV